MLPYFQFLKLKDLVGANMVIGSSINALEDDVAMDNVEVTLQKLQKEANEVQLGALNSQQRTALSIANSPLNNASSNKAQAPLATNSINNNKKQGWLTAKKT